MVVRATLTDIEALDNMVSRVKSGILVVSHFKNYTLPLGNTLSTFV